MDNAKTKYDERKQLALTAIAEIAAAIEADELDTRNPWGCVADMGLTADNLSDVADRLLERGEYADVADGAYMIDGMKFKHAAKRRA